MTDEVNENVVAEEVSLNKYKLDVAYYELREGFIVVTAPSEDEAVDIVMQSVPDGIDDFKIVDVQEMSDEEHEAFLSRAFVDPTVH